MAIQNVVLAGATGNLGPALLSALASSPFTITVFTRQNSPPPSLPANIKSLPVDYTSISALTTALAGQDAVVSTIPPTASQSQTNLIHAAVAAGVTRFLPSEFGSDLDNAENRAAPVYAPKIDAQELLKKLSGEGKISYTIVYNSAFLDWGLRVGFPISPVKKTATLHDGGDRLYSTTTLGAVGKAVVGILSKPEETRNRVVRVSEARLTLKQLLGIAEEVVGADGWTVTEPDTKDEVEKALVRVKKGEVVPETIMPFIFKAIWGEGNGGLFEETDNELLGIEELGAEGVKRLVEEVVKQ
ncbi:hypothetical protein BJY04DRAFT_233391 [Aspergillus karnatakaensis]|uniref:aromatic alcohol reductase n=1 Tax=Aspergillus karnatakaensis TaxID=1810916 RepID=UPI003CCDAFB0